MRVHGHLWPTRACRSSAQAAWTHNPAEFRSGPGRDGTYATEFATWVRDAVARGDSARLRQTLALAPHARRADPTTEHVWPLLVAAGAAASTRPATVIEGGITHGVLAMVTFVFGAAVKLGIDCNFPTQQP